MHSIARCTCTSYNIMSMAWYKVYIASKQQINSAYSMNIIVLNEYHLKLQNNMRINFVQNGLIV